MLLSEFSSLLEKAKILKSPSLELTLNASSYSISTNSEAAASQRGRVVLWDARHCQHRDNLEIGSLECSSYSRNCPEFALMVCDVIKTLSGGGRLGLQNEEEKTHRESFIMGSGI